MNTLMQFEELSVEIITENNELLFEVYSTGMALGHVKRNVVGNLYPRKERIDENLKNAEITPCVHNGHKYITESQLYDFMLEARTDKCRKFRKWVTNEVLPSIRKTGIYTVPTIPTPQPEYKYIDKTYHAQPILTATDICHLFPVNHMNLYQFIKSRLSVNTDYDLLQGAELRDYLNENPAIPRCRKSVYIIYWAGIRKIVNYFGLEMKNVPSKITETRGYVVQTEARRVMEYVRRELKGIEALTYLVESDDTPSNLENYRKILVRKLGSLNWWQVDVETVKLGVHRMSVDEVRSIHNGEYGMK